MDDMSRNFLLKLFESTQGDTAVQVSMYAIGEMLSLDRENTSKTAEELIGMQLCEIRTLSGGIGITDDGIREVQKLIDVPGSEDGTAARLGPGPVLDAAGRQGLETAMAALKSRLSSLGVDFDTLSELTADLKTIDAQLASPRPKTAIVRACLRSVENSLIDSGNESLAGPIEILLGDG